MITDHILNIHIYSQWQRTRFSTTEYSWFENSKAPRLHAIQNGWYSHFVLTLLLSSFPQFCSLSSPGYPLSSFAVVVVCISTCTHNYHPVYEVSFMNIKDNRPHFLLIKIFNLIYIHLKNESTWEEKKLQESLTSSINSNFQNKWEPNYFTWQAQFFSYHLIIFFFFIHLSSFYFSSFRSILKCDLSVNFRADHVICNSNGNRYIEFEWRSREKGGIL